MVAFTYLFQGNTNEGRMPVKDASMELHEVLKKAREDAGLTVKAVAQHLEVGRAQVWRMEKNADFISVARLKKLAKLYGVEVGALLDDTLSSSDRDTSYQLIGTAIDAVMAVVVTHNKKPDRVSIREAVITVLRHQQSRSNNDLSSRFHAEEYKAMIERQLYQD